MLRVGSITLGSANIELRRGTASVGDGIAVAARHVQSLAPLFVLDTIELPIGEPNN